MHHQSIEFAVRRRPGCARAELWMLIGHDVLYGTILVQALDWVTVSRSQSFTTH
jgi:hypothetical protein